MLAADGADLVAGVLGADARIYFQANGNFAGTVNDAIAYRAWDQTSGSAGDKVDTATSGGTSDFSLLRFDPGAARPVTPLATTGVGVAGDSFDARIMDRVVAPYLGKGGTYRVMGKDMPVPAEYYAGLSRWHRLSLMRTPRTLREIADVARTAAEPERLRRLLVGTCLARHCLGDVIVGIDTEERAARSAS